MASRSYSRMSGTPLPGCHTLMGIHLFLAPYALGVRQPLPDKPDKLLKRRSCAAPLATRFAPSPQVLGDGTASMPGDSCCAEARQTPLTRQYFYA